MYCFKCRSHYGLVRNGEYSHVCNPHITEEIRATIGCMCRWCTYRGDPQHVAMVSWVPGQMPKKQPPHTVFHVKIVGTQKEFGWVCRSCRGDRRTICDAPYEIWPSFGRIKYVEWQRAKVMLLHKERRSRDNGLHYGRSFAEAYLRGNIERPTPERPGQNFFLQNIRPQATIRGWTAVDDNDQERFVIPVRVEYDDEEPGF